MIKRYYTLDEAIAYLSEKSGVQLTGFDLFDHIQGHRLRLCAWHEGTLARVTKDNVFDFDDTILSFHDFKGYLSVVPPREWRVIRDLIEEPHFSPTYAICHAEIIESAVKNLPALAEGEAFRIWNSDSGNRKHIGRSLWEAGDEASEEGFSAVAYIHIDRTQLLIPAADLEALLGGKHGSGTPQMADEEQSEAEKKRKWPLIAGALLDLLTSDGRRNQSGIITELANRKIWGLGKTTLDIAFAEANRAYAEKVKD